MEENKPQYYTEELATTIRKMTDEEMFALMYQMEQSEYWPAMMRYNQIRSSYTQSAILVADPVKEPTIIARNQGIMLGLADMQNAIIMMWQEKKQQEAENEKLSAEGTDVE